MSHLNPVAGRAGRPSGAELRTGGLRVVRSQQHALDVSTRRRATRADDLQGGKTFGLERLLAATRVVRELLRVTDQGTAR
jgi:hypothetical protein